MHRLNQVIAMILALTLPVLGQFTTSESGHASLSSDQPFPTLAPREAINDTLYNTCMVNFDCTLVTNRIFVCNSAITPVDHAMALVFRDCVCNTGTQDEPQIWGKTFANCTACLAINNVSPTLMFPYIASLESFCFTERPNATAILLSAEIMSAAEHRFAVSELSLSLQNEPITLPFPMASEMSRDWMSVDSVFLSSQKSYNDELRRNGSNATSLLMIDRTIGPASTSVTTTLSTTMSTTGKTTDTTSTTSSPKTVETKSGSSSFIAVTPVKSQAGKEWENSWKFGISPGMWAIIVIVILTAGIGLVIMELMVVTFHDIEF